MSDDNEEDVETWAARMSKSEPYFEDLVHFVKIGFSQPKHIELGCGRFFIGAAPVTLAGEGHVLKALTIAPCDPPLPIGEQAEGHSNPSDCAVIVTFSNIEAVRVFKKMVTVIENIFLKETDDADQPVEV